MGKSKKTKNYRKDPPVLQPAILFEVEENAVELMEEHLALHLPKAKAADRVPRENNSKRVSSRIIEIDLHGLTVEDGQRRVSEVIAHFPYDQESRTYKIITGKGRHSEGGRGVLIREIYLFVQHRYGPHIVRIEESPDRVRIGGEALRGHFHVTLKGP